MSTENVKKFYESVMKDEDIKKKLSELSREYQEKSTGEENRTAFVTKEMVPLAGKMGFLFTVDDVKQYEKEMVELGRGSEVSDRELEAVTGGGYLLNFCFLIGYDAEEKGNLPKPSLCIFFGFDISSGK